MRRKIRSQEKSVQSQIANALTPFPRLWFNARFRWFLIIVLRTRLRPGADVLSMSGTDDPAFLGSKVVILLFLAPTSSRLPPVIIMHVGTPRRSHQRRHPARGVPMGRSWYHCLVFYHHLIALPALYRLRKWLTRPAWPFSRVFA